MPSGPPDEPSGNEKTARRTSSSETVNQYLSEGQAGQRSHLIQADAFLVVSAACPAIDPQDCRLNRAAQPYGCFEISILEFGRYRLCEKSGW